MKLFIRILIAIMLCAAPAYAQTPKKKSFEDLEVNKKPKKSFGDLNKNKNTKPAPAPAPAPKKQPAPAPAPKPQPQQPRQQEQARVEVRHTGFGEETWYHNPDGSAMVITKRQCVNCHGSGVCPICHGTQGKYANGMWYGCTFCAGLNGRCKTCQGKGITIGTTFINQFGNAIGYDEYGRISLGSGAPKSGGSSSRSRKSDVEPIDIIQYNTPDYTGSGSVSWCDKCKKWGYTHTHKTVR